MVDEPSHREQIRIEQYRQAREDWRHYDKLIWATPTVVFAISGAILGLSYEFLNDKLDLLIVRVFLILVLAIWIFTLLVALSKHRFFQVGRTAFFHELEGTAILETTPITRDETNKQIKKEGEGKGDEKKQMACLEWLQRCCKGRTAYNWLFASVFLTLLLVVGAIAHTIWQMFHLPATLACLGICLHN